MSKAPPPGIVPFASPVPPGVIPTPPAVPVPPSLPRRPSSTPVPASTPAPAPSLRAGPPRPVEVVDLLDDSDDERDADDGMEVDADRYIVVSDDDDFPEDDDDEVVIVSETTRGPRRTLDDFITLVAESRALPTARAKLAPGYYPAPAFLNNLGVAALLLQTADSTVLAAPTADFLQLVYKVTVQIVRGGAGSGSVRSVFNASRKLFLSDPARPVDALIHGCQLLAYAAALDQLGAGAGSAYDARAGAAEYCVLTLRRGGGGGGGGTGGGAHAAIMHLRRLLTTAPGNRSWRRGDVQTMLTQISFVVERKRGGGGGGKQRYTAGSITDAMLVYLCELARAHLHLHAAGVEVAADHFAVLQLYERVAPDAIMARHASAGQAIGSSVSPTMQLMDALLHGFRVDADAFARTLTANGVEMLGRRMVRALVALLAAYRGEGAQEEERGSIAVVWDGDNVSASMDLIRALDKPWFDVHVHGLGHNKHESWGHQLQGCTYLQYHTVARTVKESADYEALLHLATSRGALRTRPLVLVSRDRSFEVMEILVHHELGVIGGPGAETEEAAVGTRPWALHVRAANEVAVLAAWAEMCATGGSTQAKAEWRAHGQVRGAAMATDVELHLYTQAAAAGAGARGSQGSE
ncbi:hypothetical protein H9P43_004057 [Blastocladiella emersonii ATCC 22665]|nr:hypothetical protein H9P43_004057 [Blastocladiella emersonii ATCC 22665]